MFSPVVSVRGASGLPCVTVEQGADLLADAAHSAGFRIGAIHLVMSYDFRQSEPQRLDQFVAVAADTL